MENSNVSIEVNVINYLRMLRQSVFKEPLVFIDEIIQNAQRANAKTTRITYDLSKKMLTFENDGEILTDPKKLFSLSETGWSQEIQEKEQPFGSGFFSVITVSNNIEVFSGNHHFVFDVDHVLETNDPSIQATIEEESFSGFKVILHNFHCPNVYFSRINEYVASLAKYIHSMDIYMNGMLQEKKTDLQQGDNSPFQMPVEEPGQFVGWLALSKYWHEGGVQLYHNGRPVMKMEFGFLYGELHITLSALTLRAPDRKDVLRDDKWYAFNSILRTYAELLVEQAVTEQKESYTSYGEAFSHWGNKEELKKKMRFTVFRGNQEKHMSYLNDLALALKKPENKEISSLQEYELFLQQQKQKEENEIQFTLSPSNKAPDARGIIHHSGTLGYSSSGSDPYVEKPEIKEDDLEEDFGDVILVSEQPTFWMEFHEIESYEKQFNIVQHYGLKLVIARNKFDQEVLKKMEDLNVIHIRELKETIHFIANLSQLQLSLRENRALMLLDMMSRLFGFENNVFVIGNLMVEKITTIDVIQKQFSSLEPEITVILNHEKQQIFVDRSIIESSALSDSLDENLTISDYKFLLANLKNIIQELAMLKKEQNIERLYAQTLQALAIA